ELAGKRLELLREVVPVFADWQSWVTSAIPLPCWSWATSRRRPVRLVSKLSCLKSGERRISRLPSRRSRAARTRFMCVPTGRGGGPATTDDARVSGLRRSGRPDVVWTKLPRLVPGCWRPCRQDFAGGEASRPPGRAADQVRSRC